MELLDFININAVFRSIERTRISDLDQIPVLRLSNQKSQNDFTNMCRLTACCIAETDFDVKMLCYPVLGKLLKI